MADIETIQETAEENLQNNEELHELRQLSREHLSQGLSGIARTGDGLGHAFTKLQVNGKEIESIDILALYPHLRYVDLSQNDIQSISQLGTMEYLLSADLSKNKIAEIPAALNEKKFWQFGNFATNQIAKFALESAPLLAWLNLNENQLKELGLENFPNLQHLEARANQIEKISNLNLPNLKNLYLAKNSLTSVDFLQQTPLLQRLHLRENKFVTCDGFNSALVGLEYINLRDNQIADFNELTKLQVLENLKKLSLQGNPIQQDPKYRAHVIMRLPGLAILDKQPVTQEDRDAVNELKEQLEKERIEKEERERQLQLQKEAEEAAKLQQEQEVKEQAENQQEPQEATEQQPTSE